MTEWDKVPFQVTIDEPYVVELWEHYTAVIQVPYEVDNVREITTYELEEYTVQQEVPFVIETPTHVVDTQQEAYTVATKETIEHEHAVLHDKNFGLDAHEQAHQVVTKTVTGEIDEHDSHHHQHGDHHHSHQNGDHHHTHDSHHHHEPVHHEPDLSAYDVDGYFADLVANW